VTVLGGEETITRIKREHRRRGGRHLLQAVLNLLRDRRRSREGGGRKSLKKRPREEKS